MKNTSEIASQERLTHETKARIHKQVRAELATSEAKQWQGWRNIAIGALFIAATLTLLPTVAALLGVELLAGSIALGVTACMGVFLGANGHRAIRQAHAQKEGILASYKIAQPLMNQPEHQQEAPPSVEQAAAESQRWRDKILSACAHDKHASR